MNIFDEEIKELSERIETLQDDVDKLSKRVGHAIEASNYPDCETELHDLKTALSDISGWLSESYDSITSQIENS